jgi:hypothetical protein
MQKLKNIKLLGALVLIVFLHSCKKENSCDCFKSTGSIVTEKREITGFDRIIAEDNINVFIIQDTVFEVKVEAGNNLISNIQTELLGSTLILRNKNTCNWVRSYDQPFNVYLRMPVIKYVTSDGTGDIKSLNVITTDTFDVETRAAGNISLIVNNSKISSHIYGSGDLTLNGITHEHSCSIGGLAYLYCMGLQTSYTYVHSYTTGICYVSATDFLTCQIDNVGDVYCYRNPPTIQKKINGDGQLFLK